MSKVLCEYGVCVIKLDGYHRHIFGRLVFTYSAVRTMVISLTSGYNHNNFLGSSTNS